MKREIKFRGISKETGKWIYGDLLRNKDCDIAIVPPFEINMNNECSTHEVYKKTIGQYIGLKDANGVEIYEGDIVLVKSAWGVTSLKGRIIYNIHKCQFMIFNEDDNGYLSMFNDNNTYEVIGNIYDNPELLNK